MDKKSADFFGPYLLALHRGMNLTFLRYQALSKYFANDWQKCFASSLGDFISAGIDKRGIEKFFKIRDELSPEHEWEQFQKIRGFFFTYDSTEYPEQLRHIYNPPAILFGRGKWSLDFFPSISVVGARRISPYGIRAGEKIIRPLAEAGVSIVSGLAYGADTLAHEMALKYGAKTIAVLGNGIDEIYPNENKKFAEKFITEERGVLLSEYLPGTKVLPEFFPQRNRIVAGLSRALLVVEAAQKSGSLITAQLALEQGKDVFAVPSDIFAKNLQGNNNLIVSGQAQPVTSGKQVLEALGWENLATKKSAQKFLPSSAEELQILSLFENMDQLHIDEIVRTGNLGHATTSGTLALLELKGGVKMIGGQIYVRNF